MLTYWHTRLHVVVRGFARSSLGVLERDVCGHIHNLYRIFFISIDFCYDERLGVHMHEGRITAHKLG